MTQKSWFTGLVAAVFTPMKADGSLNLEMVRPVVDRLARPEHGVRALFVCGSTGEGPSLASWERKAVAEEYIRATRGRMPVIVHVGHNSLAEARDLAMHAQATGADAVSALPPSYFKPLSVDALVACMAEIAAGAPELPFYYYHLPGLTAVTLDMVAFLQQGVSRIPTLAGIKYSAPTLNELMACLQVDGGRFNLLFGSDEMLLAGLAAGAHGAVGSTYNFAAPLYQEMMRLMAAGALAEARRLQSLPAEMVRTLVNGYRIQPALKAMMRIAGVDCGPPRLPQVGLSEAEIEQLRTEITALGLLPWLGGR